MACKRDERLFLLEVIRLYRDLPVLWQVKNKEYNDRKKKESAYDVMLQKFHEKYPEATRDDVRKKINSLRTNFRKELVKIKSSQESGAGSDYIHQPTLWYFDEMLFLVDQETSLQSTSAIRMEEDVEGEGLSQTSLVGSSTLAQPFTQIPPEKKTKTDHRMELLTLACKRLHNTEDECEKIASAWAVELRKMNPTQMLLAKKAINDILFEGQMGTLHRHSVVINAPMSACPITSSMSMASWLEKPIKGVLLDITGVLYESGEGYGTVIDGSVDAVERLKANGIPVRLVTNETCATRKAVVEKLGVHGYSLSEEDIFSPVPAVLSVINERGLSPHLLVHPAIEDEFADVVKGSPTCVVMGDADEGFSFENMNLAFKTLLAMEKPTLFALGFGKYYKHKGQLQLDVGAFASALEFACDLKSEVVGKPSPQFFGAALSDIGITADEAVMVGDDIVSDVGGAQKCGMRGVLVRTGKYTPPWENHPTVKPDFIANNLSEAVSLIIEAHRK